jgi:hypothetical protein
MNVYNGIGRYYYWFLMRGTKFWIDNGQLYLTWSDRSWRSETFKASNLAWSELFPWVVDVR